MKRIIGMLTVALGLFCFGIVFAKDHDREPDSQTVQKVDEQERLNQLAILKYDLKPEPSAKLHVNRYATDMQPRINVRSEQRTEFDPDYWRGVNLSEYHKNEVEPHKIDFDLNRAEEPPLLE